MVQNLKSSYFLFFEKTKTMRDSEGTESEKRGGKGIPLSSTTVVLYGKPSLSLLLLSLGKNCEIHLLGGGGRKSGS